MKDWVTPVIFMVLGGFVAFVGSLKLRRHLGRERVRAGLIGAWVGCLLAIIALVFCRVPLSEFSGDLALRVQGLPWWTFEWILLYLTGGAVLSGMTIGVLVGLWFARRKAKREKAT